MQRTIVAAALTALMTVSSVGCSSAGSDTSRDSSPDTVSTTRSTLAPPTTVLRTTLPVVTTAPPAPTTLPPFVSGTTPAPTGQVGLRNDGIGAFRFGDAADQVRAGLITVLGAPTAPDDVVGEDRLDCDPVPSTTMHWGGLLVTFIGADADASFTGYELTGPPVNPGLANSAGITNGLTYQQLIRLLHTRPPIRTGGVLGGMTADSPRIEVSGGQPNDLVTRLSAGDLTQCGLPPPDPAQVQPEEPDIPDPAVPGALDPAVPAVPGALDPAVPAVP